MACRPATWMFTGRAPIAQPPGSDTSAEPWRATSGPSTRIAARIVLTSSYGANVARSVRGSTSMRSRSLTVTLAPSRPSSSIIVVTSLRCGTLPMVTGPSASSAPARIGRVAFLAPEMRTSPSSGTPPRIWSLSMPASGARSAVGPRCGPLAGRVRLDGKRMDLAAHTLAKRGIDLLMPLQRAPSLEAVRDDDRGEVRVVVGGHADAGAGQTRLDQPRDFIGGHASVKGQQRER